MASRGDHPSTGGAWEISDGDFRDRGTAVEKLRFFARYAVLAPSPHNRQPWRFVSSRDGALMLFADPDRALPVADPRGREALLGCGTLLYVLRVAASYFGYGLLTEALPMVEEGGPVACVRLGAPSPVADMDRALFHAVRHRRTWRGRFADRVLPEELLGDLRVAAAREGAELAFLQNPGERRAVADLVARAEQVLRENRDFVREAAAVVPEGMPLPAKDTAAAAFSRAIQASWAGTLAFIEPAAVAADRERHRVEVAPAVAVLATNGDTPDDWLRAGQALGAVLLHADTAGVEATLLLDVCEAPQVRQGLQTLVGGMPPQTLVCLGYGDRPPPPHSPRRALSEVLLEEDGPSPS